MQIRPPGAVPARPQLHSSVAAGALDRERPLGAGGAPAVAAEEAPDPSPLARLGGGVVRKKLFLRWALINTLTFVLATTAGVAFLDDLGTLGASSRASIVIVAVFVVMSAYCGTLMWRADGILDRAGAGEADGGDPAAQPDDELRAVAHDAGHVWFAVSLCQILGLLGTVAGFLIAMIGGFRNLEASDPEAVRSLLQHIADGSSTALLATLVGISASVVLALQHHLLTNSIERRLSPER
jgi:hypothetical protein